MLKVGLLLLLGAVGVLGQYQWQGRDAFDAVKEEMDKVTAENCNIKLEHELYLDEDTVSHLPDIKELEVNPIYPNRTALLHIHNMALQRSFFYSFILQRASDEYEPGFLYYFLSSIADVSANSKLNASAIYFSPNMSYTPSYRGYFNKTLPLFAPRAYRTDDFNDPFRIMRESTLNTYEAIDLGSFRKDRFSLNYTDATYLINDWYNKWLPDRENRQDSKAVYYVTIMHANNTNETFSWHGPPGGDEVPGPVKWSRPYFDCGRSNKWLFSATVPIPDIYPRHTQYRHIEYPKYVAVAVMEIDFERIDINQCPKGLGNIGPNKFANTARCKNASTECEPLHGYGFRRGGYQCRCKPGYRLPFVVRKPYLGEILERATFSEYDRAFSCDKIGYIMAMPQEWTVMDQPTRRKHIGEFEYEEFTNDHSMNHFVRTDVAGFINYYRNNMTAFNCHHRKSELEFPGDVTHGIGEQMENEARSALRLANFLSSFLQIVDPHEQFGELRLADRHLTEDQIWGEAIATVMGNVRIWGAGVFWDLNKFPNRTLFAPYAYKNKTNTRNFYAEDMARRAKTDPYLNKKWFKLLKTRWSTNTDDLEESMVKIHMRGNITGDYLTKYDHYPTKYRAATLNHGHWTPGYFDCGFLNKWVVSFVAPFFGWDSLKNKLEFKGAVIVTTILDKLDIDQCADSFMVANAFKNTHKCQERSSICVPMLGRGFDIGGYKCECEQGYEYPFDNPYTYFDGQLLEAEFENMVKNNKSRFDILKCRIAAASTIGSSIVLVVALFLFLKALMF